MKQLFGYAVLLLYGLGAVAILGGVLAMFLGYA